MIRPHFVTALAAKDVLDMLKDARLVGFLLTPILLGIFYNVIFRDEVKPELKLAYAPASEVAVVDAVTARLSRALDIKATAMDDAAAIRAAIVRRDADVGLSFTPGFAQAVASGSSPEMLVMATGSGTARELIFETLDGVLQQLAGQRPAALLRREQVDRPGSDPLLVAQLGPRSFFVLGTVVMLIAIITLMVIPMILAEESEKKTLDALVLAGSYGEVIAAKPLVGVGYTAISIAVLLALTRQRPLDLLTFAVGSTAFAIAMVGFGLLLGGLFRSATQVSTWASLFVMPFVAPAFVVGVPIPDALDAAFRAIPTSQAMRVLANGLAGRPIYPELWQAYAVMAVWAVAGYGLLIWRLSRREA